jgi:hypothetical protein
MAMIARVRGVIALETPVGEMLKVAGSISTGTIVAPHSLTANQMTMKVWAGTMTSLPCLRHF